MIAIPYKFSLREYQESLFDNFGFDKQKKRACCLWHRRTGKDKTAINLVPREMLKRVGLCFYILPTYNQGRKVIWDGIDKSGFRFLDHIPNEIRSNTNNTEMKITLDNGSILQVVGSEEIDRLRGTNPIMCVFSEYSQQNRQAWDTLTPILQENDGIALFLYTAWGMNHGYELYEMAKNNKDWFCQNLTINETGLLTSEDVENMIRQGMDREFAQQEYHNDFQASIPGAYYAKEIRLAREQGRICGVPIMTGFPVITSWDLGIDGFNSIWFGQIIGKEIHWVHYYSNRMEGITHYVNYINEWKNKNKCIIAKNILPHDARAKVLQTGKTTIEFLYDLGLDCEPAPRPATKEDGIEAVRQMFSSCWFDEKECKKGIEGLTQYRKEWIDEKGVFSISEVHDDASHPAKAIQTFAIYYHRNYSNLSPKPKKDSIPSIRDEEDVTIRRQRIPFLEVSRDNRDGWMGH